MNLRVLKICPGTLAEGFDTYSRTCLARVFNRRKVSHIFPYSSPGTNSNDSQKFIENRKRLSISGVQEKLSILLEKNKLRLTEEGEQGTHILKPIPRDLNNVDQVPANEHLTMQIARQVYKIQTAENAMIFFKNGDHAYITKRFDVKYNNTKWGKEDFASLAEKTAENGGPDFKYDYSYEKVAELLKEYVPAYAVEIEKLFSLIIFNYLFSNGDAHLKNFSILETESGDYLLSPAYDLINTRIHINDAFFALSDGLFKGGYYTESFEALGFYAYDDFYEFGLRVGILKKRVVKIIDTFSKNDANVLELVTRSFMNKTIQTEYIKHYRDRLRALNNSFTKK